MDLENWIEAIQTAAAAPSAPASTSPKRIGPAQSISEMSESMRHFVLQENRLNSPKRARGKPTKGFKSLSIDTSITDEEATAMPQPIDSPKSERSSDTEECDSDAESTNSKSMPENKRRPSIARRGLTNAEQKRYDFFTQQRNFVKGITDICEKLRFMEVSQRKSSLKPLLEKLNVPMDTYIPLCKSTDVSCVLNLVYRQ